MRRVLPLSLLSVMLGCTSPVCIIRPTPSTKLVGPPRVFLIRGFRDWYSSGIDTLAGQIRQQGIATAVLPESRWGDLRDQLGGPSEQPLVLIGFSYGADDVIRIARSLGDRHHRVDLLITIDPVTPAAVPPNVIRCIDYYQSNRVWDLLPVLRGVPLHRERGDDQPLSNVNLRTTPELLLPGTSHATIAGNPRVHAVILEQLLPTVLALRRYNLQQ